MSAIALNQVIKSRYEKQGSQPRLRRFGTGISSMGIDLDLLSGPSINDYQSRNSGEPGDSTPAIVAEDTSGRTSLTVELPAWPWMSKVGGCCASIIKLDIYRYIMVGIIVFNSIWVGIDADNNKDYTSTGSLDSGITFVIESILCAIFLVEILTRMLAKYPKVGNFFYENSSFQRMNILDFLITMLTMIDDWILSFALPSHDNEEIELFVLVRAARLFRLIRLFVLIDSLSFLAKALGEAMKSVFATFVILITAIYIWAVVFTEWSEDANMESVSPYFVDHYSTLFLSMLSMFELAIYDDAMNQVRTVLAESVLMGILLLIFIVIGGFLILNVLIGVIADVVSEQSDLEQARHLVDQMDEVFSFIDHDGNDRMTRAEFLRHGRPLLLKIGISDYVIEGVASIIEISSNSATNQSMRASDEIANYISRDEFIHFMTKMLSSPSSEDLLLINKKIESLKIKYQNIYPMQSTN
jgi:voltage-gated sodium channel